MATDEREKLTKVPAVTLGFWIIKILATTLGETAGDTVSMSMDLGYLVGDGDLREHPRGAGLVSDRRALVSTAALLGDHNRFDHCGHDHG